MKKEFKIKTTTAAALHKHNTYSIQLYYLERAQCITRYACNKQTTNYTYYTYTKLLQSTHHSTLSLVQYT